MKNKYFYCYDHVLYEKIHKLEKIPHIFRGKTNEGKQVTIFEQSPEFMLALRKHGKNKK